MALLSLSLLLLARPLATPLRPQPWEGAIREIALDMAPSSFDDQYRHCRSRMREALPVLNRSEFIPLGAYAEAWAKAVALWGGQAKAEALWDSQAKAGALWDSQVKAEALWDSQAKDRALWDSQAKTGDLWGGQAKTKALWEGQAKTEALWDSQAKALREGQAKVEALWDSQAKALWGGQAKLGPLRLEQALALLAYTMEEGLYLQFNRAVRQAGRSRRHYLRSFPFKVMHFLLTQALADLRRAQGHPRCLHVFRGVGGIRFSARPGQIVRFGQFTSSSLLRNVSDSYGTTTTFDVDTCHGAYIQNFSSYPEEEEVLIPPFETFRVTNVTHDGDEVHIQLRSHGVHSKFNCAWFRGRSLPRAPPGLAGLLLAVLAAVTGTP